MASNPKVSVLIFNYNYAHFLDDAIGSVLSQTFTDYELIIVDNHSTDNSDEVVQKYLSHPLVAYHKNERNLGIAGNMNKCLDLAKGVYIKFLCSDDKLHPTMLEKFVVVMDKYPGVSLVTCDKQVFDAKSFIVNIPLQHLQDGREAILSTLNTNCWIGEPSSVMLRRENMSIVGRFTNEYRMYIDWEMWLRQLAIGDCYIIPEVLVYIRHQPNQHGRMMKHLKYVNVFEEYRLAKDIQMKKFEYHITSTDRELKKALRKRATNCVKIGMIKNIPHLYKKQTWPVFVSAAKIGFQEGVYGPLSYEVAKKTGINVLKFITSLLPLFE